MRFSKYHALGNTYIVIDPRGCAETPCINVIKRVCDSHYGIGSDGLLYGPLTDHASDFGLRIFNPDGSEAEKSGNGLRIFSRYLWDAGLVGHKAFSIQTLGGTVGARVHESGQSASIQMGKVRFTHEPEGAPDIHAEEITVYGTTFQFYRASVGNPHCVIPVDTLTTSLATNYGPVIETDDRFANRTNVQFAKTLDRQTIRIEIWERGTGYTLASGSSSTAAAAVAHALGYCDEHIRVQMPGGVIEIALDSDCRATMTGPVVKIADGMLSAEVLRDLAP